MDNSLSFRIPRAGLPLSDVLSGMPRGFKELARRGFAVLADLDQQYYAAVLRAAVTSLESKDAPLDDLEKHLNLSKNDLSSLFASSMLIIPLLGEGGSADEFANAAMKVDLIPANLLPKIKPFIETVVSERTQIARAIRRAALPSQVLPFLSSIEVVVDMRLSFEEGRVLDGVPVALFHIDTDADNEEIWFQASRRQLERMKSDIDEALGQMDVAETWGRKEPEK